jgi:PTS system mannose-specific IIC component
MEIIIISVLGSLLCLDRVFIQAMVSRPVIIAPLIGLFFNNIYAGLIIGAIIELIWIDRLPIGTYIPPNDSIAAVVATSIALLVGSTSGGVSPELIALAVLLAIPFGALAKQIDIMIIKSNDALSDKALQDAASNNIRGIEIKKYLGLLKVFLSYAVFLLIVQTLLVSFVAWIFPRLNETLLVALSFTYYFLPLLGIAVALNMLKLRNTVAIVCAVFLAVAMLLEFFHVL